MTLILGTKTEAPLLAAFGAAVAEDLQGLAELHDREPDEELLTALQEARFPDGLGMRLRSERGRQAGMLMAEALGQFSAPVSEKNLDRLAVDFAEIYLTHGLRASPYESVWLDDDHLARQEPMFQVRAFYRRHGLAAANWSERADDHIVLQLQFLRHLLEEPSADTIREAAGFMDEHLLRWIDRFADQVTARCATPYFAGVATLTAAYVDELRDLLAEILEEPRPTAEEIEARMQPEKPAAACGAPSPYVPGSGPGW
jgi:TorA maturation chaperone TorD